MKPNYLQYCEVSALAIKTRRGNKTTWHSEAITPRKMAYIGKRLVKDGVWETEIQQESFEDAPYESAPFFVPMAYHVVYLFSPSESENPVYVFPDNVKILEKD